MTGGIFERFFCDHCGCISTTYQTDGLLKQHYLSNYDLSDHTQNNFIVLDNKMKRKKAILEKVIVKTLQELKSTPKNVLEIACGRGQLLLNLKQIFSKTNFYGVDPNINVAQLNGLEEININNNFFDPKDYLHLKFDLVIAHGFLNRSPPYVELKNIRKIISKGGILSLECMVLDNSPHAPMIWDHSFWYSYETLKIWLTNLGFDTLYQENNGTTMQIVCRAVAPRKNKLTVNSEALANSKKLFESYFSFWKSLKTKEFEDNSCYLFGAGMHTAIFLSSLQNKIKFLGIIDELKTGTFFGYPIRRIKDAIKNPGRVLIVTREPYRNAINAKLTYYGIDGEFITYNFKNKN